jgi:hypothetical protein
MTTSLGTSTTLLWRGFGNTWKVQIMVSLLLSVGSIALAVKKQDRNGGSVRSLSSTIPKQELISFLKTFHT